MLNKVTLIGFIGKAGENRKSQSGLQVLKFPLATQESFKDKSGELKRIVEWHNVVKFSPVQDCSQFAKGVLVYVEGKLKTSKYLHKLGVEVYSTSIIADRIFILRETKKDLPPEDVRTSVVNDHIVDDDIPF
ncbi:MAG: single-stranded DNA-binding protein [Holosporaceae bacterium]|jgi:single-strand DNA-binding protein|nr:single-stranded DNA-binding protein [Holosporaceae bacterium]